MRRELRDDAVCLRSGHLSAWRENQFFIFLADGLSRPFRPQDCLAWVLRDGASLALAGVMVKWGTAREVKIFHFIFPGHGMDCEGVG